MDNFFERPSFQKMPNSLHDCYFYYYSSCTKVKLLRSQKRKKFINFVSCSICKSRSFSPFQGKNCEYRHEPIALGHETMCPKWIDGLCYDVKCKNRHMFIKVSVFVISELGIVMQFSILPFVCPSLQKNRSRIPCFFESQPEGCKKSHCVFKHNDNKGQTDDITDAKKKIHDISSESGVGDVSVNDTSN